MWPHWENPCQSFAPRVEPSHIRIHRHRAEPRWPVIQLQYRRLPPVSWTLPRPTWWSGTTRTFRASGDPCSPTRPFQSLWTEASLFSADFLGNIRTPWLGEAAWFHSAWLYRRRQVIWRRQSRRCRSTPPSTTLVPVQASQIPICCWSTTIVVLNTCSNMSSCMLLSLSSQPHKTYLRFCINFPQATLPATAAYRYQSVACRTELFRTSPGLLADQRLAAGQHLPRTSQRHSCRRQHRRGCTSSTMPLTCANLERRWSTSRLQVKRTT